MIIKTSSKTILLTLLLILKTCLSVEINFWKTSLRITFKNLRSFQGKYLWRSSILIKALSLRFTVIFLMVLKFMVLRNFIIILFYNTFFFSCGYILINFSFDLVYLIITTLLFYYWYILLLYDSCKDINKLLKTKRSNYIKLD